ncbi:hypothetical protein HYW46_02590 [Candidatus Daviesbacteria bacterium]|nr:hypothetical protein [Candidatus Daviesbacteria bacterium]
MTTPEGDCFHYQDLEKLEEKGATVEQDGDLTIINSTKESLEEELRQLEEHLKSHTDPMDPDYEADLLRRAGIEYILTRFYTPVV